MTTYDNRSVSVLLKNAAAQIDLAAEKADSYDPTLAGGLEKLARVLRTFSLFAELQELYD